MTAASAWAALQDALATTDPSCKDDARFTDDGRADSANSDLVDVCVSCPVFDMCGAYARAEKNHRLVGFWAGRRRGTRRDRASRQ